MLSYLCGKVVLWRREFLILDVAGVGYGIFVDPQIKIKDSAVDSNQVVALFIHQHLREDINALYGFLTFAELELFEKLISVNGVGPKAAMNIMSAASLEKIIAAINQSDLGFFVALPGIGKKAAAKIILELKSKLGQEDSSAILSDFEAGDEVAEALISLGYKKIEIAKLLTQLPAEITSSEAKIKWCLKNLAK